MSALEILSWCSRTDKIAASFNTFSSWAPEKPGVLLATASKETSLDNCLFLACTFKISSLPLTSGKETSICLSNLPGLNKAGSKTSTRFVAAKTITPELF